MSEISVAFSTLRQAADIIKYFSSDKDISQKALCISEGKVKLNITGPTNDEIEQGEGSWNIKFSGDVDDLHNAMNHGIFSRNRNNAITGTNRS